MTYDLHNTEAIEGCDRCYCGCKYWEHDTCIDCGTPVTALLSDPEWYAENRDKETETLLVETGFVSVGTLLFMIAAVLAVLYVLT